MIVPGSCFPWFALQVRPNREKSVQTLLEFKGCEVFLPMLKQVRYYARKRRHVEAPCFSGYLFCRFDPGDRLPIMTTPGVYRAVGAGKIPEPVPDEEIANLQLLISSGVGLQRCPYVSIGDRVRIERGPLTGVEGVLVGMKGFQRVVVSITLLRRSVAAEVSLADVRRSTDSPTAVAANRYVDIGYAAS